MLKIKSSNTKVDIKDFSRKSLLTDSLSVSSWSPALLPEKFKETWISKIITLKSMYVQSKVEIFFEQREVAF